MWIIRSIRELIAYWHALTVQELANTELNLEYFENGSDGNSPEIPFWRKRQRRLHKKLRYI